MTRNFSMDICWNSYHVINMIDSFSTKLRNIRRSLFYYMMPFHAIASLVVGAAKEVMGQQTVVGGAVAVEEADVGLYVLRGEGLVGAVALVEAVQPLAHGSALPLSSTAY